MKRRVYTVLSFWMCFAVMLSAQGQAKYIFYFIGDGMGVNQVNLTETYLSALKGEIGTTPICFASFPHSAMVTTFSATNGVTDSAAGGTALATGHKTKNGALGVKADGTTRVTSVAERAHEKGMAVGIVTSVSVDHATPAAFYAHVDNRGKYNEIGHQLVASGFDYFAGSGFLQPETQQPGTNLYQMARHYRYTLAYGYDQYRQKYSQAEKLIFFPTQAEMKADVKSLPYALDRNGHSTSLEQFTRAGISFLSEKANRTGKGFFMMVEGGKIDWACHSNDAATMVHEVLDMDASVRAAYDFYKLHPDSTLIIVTADHETGGIALGTGAYDLQSQLLEQQKLSAERFSRQVAQEFQQKGSAFTWALVKTMLEQHFGLWNKVSLTQADTERLKQAYNQFCKGVAQDKKTLYASENIIASTARQLMAEKCMIAWTSTGHSNGYVPAFAIGAGAGEINGRMDNTHLAKLLFKILQ